MNSRLIDAVDAAAEQDMITPSAAKNLRQWLVEPQYAEYVEAIAEHIDGERWQALDDAFWTIIPFGTGGRRGRMYPFGSNTINSRTIGESAQGLADYVRQVHGREAKLSCAIARDTRHRSEEFARLCAEVMLAAGFKVYFLDDPRSTPELSFAVRYKGCSCGIMVTASHNPPSDNAVKVYWSTGGQILPPHDAGIIERVMATEAIHRADFDEGLASGQVEMCQREVDRAFIEAVLTQATAGPRDLKILYSPLHGVGSTAVVPALEGDGFTEVEVFGPHSEPDGDFPNVHDHVANPENPKVFDVMIAHAKREGHDLCLATDPDCDRIGVAAPLEFKEDSPWATLTGNQIGALLADYVLETRKEAGQVGKEKFIAKTLVTSEMIRRIADGYGVRTEGNLLVGFKWIAGVIDAKGAENFLFGTEESHGYMVGAYARDKDGAAASMLVCELAARLKAKNKTLHQKLDDLFWQHGVHAERTISVLMPGSDGMARMSEVMAMFRNQPPESLAGIDVARRRDYTLNLTTFKDGSTQPLPEPRGDMVMLDLADEGNYVACRPSGTEPKIKFYMFTYTPAEQLHNLAAAKDELQERLNRMESDLRMFSGV